MSESTPTPHMPTVTLNPEDHPMAVYLTQEDGNWNWAFRVSHQMMANPNALRTAMILLSQYCDMYVQNNLSDAA